jgi:hypothetical protein
VISSYVTPQSATQRLRPGVGGTSIEPILGPHVLSQGVTLGMETVRGTSHFRSSGTSMAVNRGVVDRGSTSV